MNDHVVLSDYDPHWPARFADEETVLRKALADRAIAIYHFGSTAVPGLCAKPIIDIMVTVNSLGTAADYESAMLPLGYEHVAHDDDDVRLFFRKRDAKTHQRTHHVHFVRAGSDEERRHLQFRDYLIANERGRSEYANLKQAMAVKFKDDRDAYTLSKTAFITFALASCAAPPSND